MDSPRRLNANASKPRHVPAFCDVWDSNVERLLLSLCAKEDLQLITRFYRLGMIGLKRVQKDDNHIEGFLSDVCRRCTKLTIDKVGGGGASSSHHHPPHQKHPPTLPAKRSSDGNVLLSSSTQDLSISSSLPPCYSSSSSVSVSLSSSSSTDLASVPFRKAAETSLSSSFCLSSVSSCSMEGSSTSISAITPPPSVPISMSQDTPTICSLSSAVRDGGPAAAVAAFFDSPPLAEEENGGGGGEQEVVSCISPPPLPVDRDFWTASIGFTNRSKRWTLCPSRVCCGSAVERDKIVGQWKVLQLGSFTTHSCLVVPPSIRDSYDILMDDEDYFVATLCPQQTYHAKHIPQGSEVVFDHMWHFNRRYKYPQDILVFVDDDLFTRVVWILRNFEGMVKYEGNAEKAEQKLLELMTNLMIHIRNTQCKESKSQPHNNINTSNQQTTNTNAASTTTTNSHQNSSSSNHSKCNTTTISNNNNHHKSHKFTHNTAKEVFSKLTTFRPKPSPDCDVSTEEVYARIFN